MFASYIKISLQLFVQILVSIKMSCIAARDWMLNQHSTYVLRYTLLEIA